MKQIKSPRPCSDGPFRKEEGGNLTGSGQAELASRESESRYRAMVEAFDGLIYICSADYRVEFMNPRLIERTGYDGTGEYCYKVLHERDSICPWCVNERVFRGETVRWEVQSPKDHRWYCVVNTPIYYSDGRVSKQAMIQDITELKQKEEALRQGHAELERRVEERTAHLKQANEQLLREIEERQQIEDRLRESEELFLAFMQHMPAGAIIRDLQGRYLFANKAWEKAFAKEWQGKTLEEIWPVDTAWHMRELDQKVIATGEPLETLVTLQQEDGPHTWLINWFPILGQDGRPVLVGSAGIDVTKRQEAEAALEAERQRLFSLLNGLPNYVYLHAPDYTIRYANRVFREHFGEPNGKRCYEILRGRSQPCGEKCSSERVLKSQSPQEAQWTSPSGRVYQLYAYPFTDVDGSMLVLKLGIDITEQHRAEEALYREKEKYRLLVEELPLGILITGPTGEHQYLNPRFVEMFGYTLEEIPTMEEAITRLFPHPQYRQEVISAWIKDSLELLPGEPKLRTFTTVCKDGTEKVINFRLVYLENGSRIVLCEDITERHLAQEALIESEKKFGQLVEYAADELILHDNGRIIEVNQRTCDDLGYSREELLKMTVFDLEVGISPQDLQKIWEQQTESPFTVQGVHRRKDGSTYPIEVRVARFRYGGRRLLLAMARDITDRHRAQEALIESEKRFRQLVEYAADGLFLHDKGKIIEVNQQACNSLGFSREELLKMDVADIEVSISSQELQKSWEQPKSPITVRGVHRRKDGSTFPVEVRAGDIIYGGRHLRLALVRDITERLKAEEARRESELRYRRLVVAAPLGISIIGKDGRYKYLNPKFEEMFGYALEEIPTGREWFTKAYPDSSYRRQVVDDWKEEFQRPRIGEVRPRTFRVRCKDGTEKVVNFRSVALVTGDCLIFYEDITKRVQAEEALSQSELKYRNLVEQIPAVTYMAALDEASTTLFISPQIEAMLGISPADYAADPDTWRKRLHPQDRDRVLAEVARCRDTGEPFVSEYRMVARDGRIVWFRDEARLVHGIAELPPFLQGVMLDITNRKELEEALKESEEQYRLLVNQIPSVVFKGYADGRMEFFDRKIKSLTGYQKEDFDSGRLKWTELVLPEDAPGNREVLLKALKGNRSYVREYRIRKRDGEILWLQGRGQIFCNDAGRIEHISGVFFDISERKRAEEALRQSELKYRTLVEQIPAVVFQGHMDWSIDYFDRKIEALTGYAKEDFDSRRLKWSDLIPAEEMDYVKRTFLEALKTDKSYVREHRIRKKNGEYTWVQCRGRIFCDAEGKAENVRGVVFDITARKRAEEALKESEARYRLLAENVSDVIWTADMNLKLSYVSPSSNLLIGFSPEEVMQQGLEAILTPVSLEQARGILAEEILAVAQGPRDPNRSRIIEMELIRKDGSIVWTEVKASFLRDEQGRPVGLLGVSRDISKRKEVELALRRREAILEAISFAAEKFLQPESWEKDIQNILGRLGQSADASRVYIFENHLKDTGDLLTSQRYEWTAPGIEPQIDNLEMQNISWREAGFDRWEEQLSQGQMIVGHAQEFPPSEQEMLASQDIKSIVVVPIFVGSQWWGMIGLDECLIEREWSPVELEALKTAASTLGAAILHERAEQALRKSEQKLRSLAAQLLTAQENERKRLAAELHDELGHALLTLKLSIRSLEKKLTPEQISFTQEFKKMHRFVVETIKEVRRLYLDLSPGDLEDLGLTEALRDMIEDVASLQKKVKWSVILDNLDGLFPLPVQTAIYRVIQEALTNIGKHAKAKNVAIIAKRESPRITIIIEDDGRGFDASKVLDAKRSLGLLTMEERVKILGGTFSLWSQTKRGTRISFTIPFPEEG